LRWQNEYSAWIFERVVGRKDQSRLFVVVRRHDGPTVCASLRSSGMHYQYSTAKSGSFRVLLDSNWVQSARPDYLTLSPVCSWGELARRYMKMQTLAMAGSDQLPTFTGTIQKKVDAAVRYVKARGIQYDAKPDQGGYPHQNIADVLTAGRTDCKGFTTLLYALLRKAGVKSDPVLLNAHGMTPMSFSVPDRWPDHVMLYVPGLGRYIDLTGSLPSRGEFTWQTSADSYAGDVVLDLATGRFGVVPSHLAEGGS
jgi:transglutaminase-like putative cysteine protease